LRRCIAHNIFPSHIDRLLSKSKFSFKNYKSSHLYNRSKLNFFNRIIRLELRDIYFHIRNSYENMFHLSDEIYRTLPVSICNNFFNKESFPLFKHFQKENNRFHKKFNFLLSKRRNLSVIKPVQYYGL